MLFFRNYFFTFIPNLSCVYSLEFSLMDQFYLQQNQIISHEGNRKNNKTLTYLYLSRLMTKPTKWHVRPAKTRISLGIRPVWSETSLSAWRKLVPLATHWADSEDSDQTGWIPRLIRVFAGRIITLLVLSWGGLFIYFGLFSCRIRHVLWPTFTQRHYMTKLCQINLIFWHDHSGILKFSCRETFIDFIYSLWVNVLMCLL